MKRFLLACALVCAASGSAVAAEKVTDVLCPNAVPPIVALNGSDQSDPDKFYAGASTVIEAYKTCASVALSQGQTEPQGHYAQVKEAQYEILAGRALVAQGKIDDAKSLLSHARKLADNVVTWRSGGLGYAASNNVNVGNSTSRSSLSNLKSKFADAAGDIRDAADADLKALDKNSAAPAPNPQPSGN